MSGEGIREEGVGDRELLEQYAHKGVQEAFAQIVKRYVDLVYITCFRDLRDHHLAEDATQAVFMVLANKARSLRREVVLAGWLFQTARLVVRNVRKQEARRRIRERRAAEMIQQAIPGERKSDASTPLISEGLEDLRGKDRDAILLHYYQKKTLAEVGEATGVSEDAARMRVTRAIQKLRSFFARKGQTLAIGAVAALLLSNAVQAAPPAVSQGVLTTVCPAVGATVAAGGAAAALAKATMNTLLVAKLKMAAAVAALTLLVPTAGLATYAAIANGSAKERKAAELADATPIEVIVEGVGTVPAVPAAAGSPTRIPASPSPATAATPKNSGQPKPKPPLQTATAKPEAPPADLLRFKVENGLIVVSGPAMPADGKPAPIALRNLVGETTIARKPTGLVVENVRGSDKGQVRTKVDYQIGNSFEIQRTIKPKVGKEYAMIFRQSQASDPASKAIGQTTLRATADGGETWNSWVTDSFPRFVESDPLAYLAHVAPALRDFSAWNMCAVPAPVARSVLSDAKSAARRESLAEMLSHPDKGNSQLVWRREIDMLDRDTGFLIDCMEMEDLDVRSAAFKRLGELTGKPVAFDVNAPPQKRKAKLNLLRRATAKNGF